VGKLEGKRPLGRPRHGWVYNIRMDLQEVECGYIDWIGLAQDRDRWWTLVSAVMNLRVPWNVGNFLSSCKPVICSGRTLHHGVSKYLLTDHISATFDMMESDGNCKDFVCVRLWASSVVWHWSKFLHVTHITAMQLKLFKNKFFRA